MKYPDFHTTRYAPTPSGYLHLGNVFSFALTAWLAEQKNAGIVLRIDDLDQERVRSEYVEDIFETLHFLQLPWQGYPQSYQEYQSYSGQHSRLDRYEALITELADKNLIYACTCSRTEWKVNGDCDCRSKGLPLNTRDTNLRLITDEASTISYRESGTTQTLAFPQSMRDFIIRKKDGMPSYQLASVADDIDLSIDLIVRGEDLLHSTLAQHFLADKLGLNNFRKIDFLHHPLIKEKNGSKLSKSKGATSIRYLRTKGYSSHDVYAMIASSLFPETSAASWRELAKLFFHEKA